MAYREKSGNWTARWRMDGKRISKGGFTSKRNAEHYEAQQKYKVECGLVGLPVEESLEISRILAGYKAWSEGNKRPASAKRDAVCLAIWREYFADAHLTTHAEITPQIIHGFLAWRSVRLTARGKPASKRTINIDLLTLRRALAWAVQSSLIQSSPLSNLPLYKEKRPGLPRYLTVEEINALENLAKEKNPSLYFAIAVLVRTGVRSGLQHFLQYPLLFRHSFAPF